MQGDEPITFPDAPRAELDDALAQLVEQARKVLQTQGRALALQDVAHLMKRFEQEARILARLKHDGIVRIFKTFDLGGRPVIEIEHLPNGSLATHLKAVRARGAVEIARFMERVARAVGFAHGH